MGEEEEEEEEWARARRREGAEGRGWVGQDVGGGMAGGQLGGRTGKTPQGKQGRTRYRLGTVGRRGRRDVSGECECEC